LSATSPAGLSVDKKGFPHPLNRSGTKANNKIRRQCFTISPNPFSGQYKGGKRIEIYRHPTYHQ
ncbi:hypothetical protein, partial [Enterococcus faecalis]|uniref:hypothetical protein n=1 Tax=Enterococcus faecalis TaxID=1351 RepID=UPI003986421E